MSEHPFVSSGETKDSKTHSLSIRISPDGFSFSLIRHPDNSVVAGNNHPVKIKDADYFFRRFDEWYHEEKMLHHSYPHVEIVFYTEKFTFIPDPFFQPDKVQLVFRQLFSLTSPVKIITTQIESIHYHLLFALPEILYNRLSTRFEHVSFTHPVKLIAEYPGLDRTGNQLIMFFTSEGFYALLYQGNNLLYANSFAATHPNDVIFYIFHLLRQEKLQPDKTQMTVTGIREQSEKIRPHLEAHFGLCDFPDVNREIVFREECGFRPEYPLYSMFRNNP